MKKILLFISIISIIMVFSGCKNRESENETAELSSSSETSVETAGSFNDTLDISETDENETEKTPQTSESVSGEHGKVEQESPSGDDKSGVPTEKDVPVTSSKNNTALVLPPDNLR